MNNIIVDTHTLFFAFKYALGRNSTAPLLVMTSIMNNIDKLDNSEIERYIEEISNYNNHSLHEATWIKFKEDLEFELNFRNKF